MKLLIEITDPLGTTVIASISRPFLDDPLAMDALLKILEDHRILSIFAISLRFTRNISDDESKYLLNPKKHPNIKRLNERRFILSSRD